MVATDLATNANFVDEHEDQRLREKVNHSTTGWYTVGER
jgi:hypothetical protein